MEKNFADGRSVHKKKELLRTYNKLIIRKTLRAILLISWPQPFVQVKEGSCCDVIHLPFLNLPPCTEVVEVKKSRNLSHNKAPGGLFPDLNRDLLNIVYSCDLDGSGTSGRRRGQ